MSLTWRSFFDVFFGFDPFWDFFQKNALFSTVKIYFENPGIPPSILGKKSKKTQNQTAESQGLSKNKKKMHGNPIEKKNASYRVLGRFFSCFSEKLPNSAVPFFLKSWKTAKKRDRIPMLWKKMKNEKRVFCVFLKTHRDTHPLFSNFLKIKKTQKWKKHAFFAFFSDFLTKIGA